MLFLGWFVLGRPLAFDQIHAYDVGRGVGENVAPGKLAILGRTKLKAPGLCVDGGGSLLQSAGNGVKSWALRFTLRGLIV